MRVTDSSPTHRHGRSRSWRKPVTIVAVLFALWIASRFIPIFDWGPQVMAWIHGLGPLGLLVFIALHVVATIAFVPAIVFGIGASLVYGFWQAVAISLVSTVISAMAVFVISRFMARGWVAARIAGNPRYSAIDDAVGRQGWKVVLLTRLSPGFPFTLLNYALGVTQVSAASFLFGTAIGMAPRTILHVYAGVFGSSLASLGVDGPGPEVLQILTVAVGVIITVLATVYITRLVGKAVNEGAPQAEEDPPADVPELAAQPAE